MGLLELGKIIAIENFYEIGMYDRLKIALKICVRWIMTLWRSLWAILAVIKLNSGDFPNEKCFMEVLISEGKKHLGGKVRGRGLSKNELISLTCVGVVLWFWRR